VRITVDWSKLQPAPGVAPALAAANDGCDRGIAPCGAFAGLRDEFAAVAAAQRAGAGFEPVIVIYGVPPWAAMPAGGCERLGTLPRSRPLAPAALAGYRRLIDALLGLAGAQGLALHWWSAWNEPNEPFFISPQRTRCDGSAPAASPPVYATLVRTLRDELRGAGGDRRIVLGDLAGLMTAGPHAVSIAEFVAALPDDVVCAGPVWAVHDYGVTAAQRTASATQAAARAPLLALEQALDRRGGCAVGARIWITETGAAAPDARPAAAASDPPRDPLAACRRLADALADWNLDPRVDAVFQYTFREDPAFRVGLADPTLRNLYPAYYVWLAWGSRRAGDPAPAAPPAQCA
jgi:hypothetical protein